MLYIEAALEHVRALHANSLARQDMRLYRSSASWAHYVSDKENTRTHKVPAGASAENILY